MSLFETLFYILWRGVAIGIIISAPMGPVGILCVQRTLEKGRKTGFFTGIGATISDLFYSLLTGFGLSFIEEFLEKNQNIIQLVGSVVLIAFAVYLFKSNPARNLKRPGENKVSAKKNILNGFLFTFSNPLIIFLIIGLFARFNFMLPEVKWYHYIVGYLSIAAGALFWWWLVTFFVEKVRSHFNLRSMWLINKIIGGIILIFAIVGIVTSSINLASAASPHRIYLNSTRGFHPLDSTLGKPLLLSDTLGKQTSRHLAITPANSVTLAFRGTNLNNKPKKSYPAMDESGRKSKIKHPGWGVRLTDSEGESIATEITTTDIPFDDIYQSSRLVFKSKYDNGYESGSDSLIDVANIKEGVGFFCETNAFRFIYSQGYLSIYAGDTGAHEVTQFAVPLRDVADIEFFVMPGGALEIDNISIDLPHQSLNEISYFANPDILDTYIRRSTDPMEGIWSVYDRYLDEDKMRPGGDYRVAIIADPENDNGNRRNKNYIIVYLDGAIVNPALWQPGMLKGRLLNSGFQNVWQVEWTDATGTPVPYEIKAEYSSPVLTLTFPYQNSTVRLRKINI